MLGFEVFQDDIPRVHPEPGRPQAFQRVHGSRIGLVPQPRQIAQHALGLLGIDPGIHHTLHSATAAGPGTDATAMPIGRLWLARNGAQPGGSSGLAERGPPRRAQKISATQQRRLPPAFSISSSATLPIEKPHSVSDARWASVSARAACWLIHTRFGASVIALPA